MGSNTSLRNTFLRFLLALSLIYYLALVVVLALQPMSLGVSFEGSLSILDRYIEAILGALVVAIGIFILRRVPSNAIGPLIIIYGVGTTGWSTPQDLGAPWLTSFAHLFFTFYWNSITLPAAIVLLFCFPTGSLYTRRVKPWVVLYVLLMAVENLLILMARSPGNHDPLGFGDLPQNPIFVPALAPYYELIYGPIYIATVLLGIGWAMVSLIRRYRASQARERLQIKWLIWVCSLSILLILVEEILTSGNSYSTVANSPPILLFLIIFYGMVGTAPAIGVGLAILRSRLWEIDIIIRRTLVYTVLTAVLALIYLVSVVLLQLLSRRVTGQTSDLAIIFSTLAIAAMFNPIRLLLQRVIDRRYYRGKYNAAQAIESFSRSVRKGVDRDTLTQALHAIVQDSLQPEFTGIWLAVDKPGLNGPTK